MPTSLLPPCLPFLTDDEKAFFTVFYKKHICAFEAARLGEIVKTYESAITQIPINDVLIDILRLEARMTHEMPDLANALQKALCDINSKITAQNDVVPEGDR